MKSRWIALAAILPLAMGTVQAQESEQNEQAITELQPITVTGEAKALTGSRIQAAREEIKLTPGGVTLVEEDIGERNMSSLADMMRYVPGLYMVSDTGGDEVFFSARGSNLDAIDYDLNGIMLLRNGIPITTPDGNNHNRVIDPLSTLYAIVARGANGMKYGASTLGGAINFISPTAYDLPNSLLFLSGGSFGQAQARVTVSKVFDKGFDALFTLIRTHRDGYREHSVGDKTAIYANAGWRISQSLGTRLYLTYVDNDIELAGGLTRAQFEADLDQAGADAVKGNFQKNVKTWRIASKTTWQPEKNQRLEFGIAYEFQTLYHPIVADFFVPGADQFIAFDGLVIDTNHRHISAMIRYEHQIGNHNLLFGANYRVGGEEGKQYGNNHGEAGGLQTLVDQEADTLQVYFMDRWHIGKHWTLIPAIQLINANRELNNISVDDFGHKTKHHTDGHYFGVNPRLGVIFNVRPEFQVFANVSRLYEPPTFFLLKNQAPGAEGTLEAMSGTVVEVGTRGKQAIGRASSFEWNLTFYYSWIENEILTAKNPKLTDNNPATTIMGGNRFFTTNIDDTVHAGIEALLRAHIALGSSGVHAIEPVLSLTLTKFEFDNNRSFGNNDLPGAPGYVLRGEVLYRNANGFYIGPTFDLVGDRYADYANTYTVDSYALLGLLAGWSNEHLSVYLEVENLLDEEYVATHSVLANADEGAAILRPGGPLSVYAGLEWRF